MDRIGFICLNLKQMNGLYCKESRTSWMKSNLFQIGASDPGASLRGYGWKKLAPNLLVYRKFLRRTAGNCINSEELKMPNRLRNRGNSNVKHA